MNPPETLALDYNMVGAAALPRLILGVRVEPEYEITEDPIKGSFSILPQLEYLEPENEGLLHHYSYVMLVRFNREVIHKDGSVLFKEGQYFFVEYCTFETEERELGRTSLLFINPEFSTEELSVFSSDRNGKVNYAFLVPNKKFVSHYTYKADGKYDPLSTSLFSNRSDECTGVSRYNYLGIADTYALLGGDSLEELVENTVGFMASEERYSCNWDEDWDDEDDWEDEGGDDETL